MYAQNWGAPSKKRGRDEDGHGDGDVAIGGTQGFTEHRNVSTRSGDDVPSLFLSASALTYLRRTETSAVPSLPHVPIV